MRAKHQVILGLCAVLLSVGIYSHAEPVEEADVALSAPNPVIDVRAARVVIVINKASKGKTAQTLKLYENGRLQFTERVSTGRERNERTKPNVHFPKGRKYVSETPVGKFPPLKLDKSYRSKTWGNAKMRFSVFFADMGTAIHAAHKKDYDNLGFRASGGCVRVKRKAARRIYDHVRESYSASKKRYDTLIFVQDLPDGAEIPKDVDELPDDE